MPATSPTTLSQLPADYHEAHGHFPCGVPSIQIGAENLLCEFL